MMMVVIFHEMEQIFVVPFFEILIMVYIKRKGIYFFSLHQVICKFEADEGSL